MKDYHNSMPLQHSSHRLLRPLLKSVHVLGQKKAVRQTAGPSFVTWSLLGKPFLNNKERIMSKHTILRMPDSAQENTAVGHAYWSGNQVPRPLSPYSTPT